MGYHIQFFLYTEYLLEAKNLYGDEGEEVNLKSAICGAQPIQGCFTVRCSKVW